MRREQQILRSFREVETIRKTATLLQSTDYNLGQSFFLEYAAQESREMATEISAAHVRPLAIQDELNDVIVLTQTGLNIKRPTAVAAAIDRLPTTRNILQSSSLEKLEEYILDLQDSPRPLPEILNTLLVILETFPSGLSIPDGMMKTIRKVLANRPPELYSNICPIKKRELRPEEELEKYAYLEKATRLIRNRCGNRMKFVHWQPIERLMHDFYNSEYNLKNLETALLMMSIEDFTELGWAAGDEFVWKTLNGIIAEAGGVVRYQH